MFLREERKNMKNKFRRLLSAALSAALVSAGAVIPVSASEYTPIFKGDTVLNEWKFDFGDAANTPAGYINVPVDKNVIVDKDYGFIGNDGKASLMANVIEKYDSYIYKEGQTMNLAVGGGETDGVGIVPDDSATYPEYTTGEYYPVSFGLHVDNGSYYRVRATVTTLDPETDATASMFYERRHPVYKGVTIPAGGTYTAEFSVDVETINFKNEGNFVDDMLNISLLGENAALASLDIQQIDESTGTATTLWVLGDSTVTDGSASVPYFDLQNYTGVGAYLSKYLPSDIAVSNQGEGGLNATDNSHFAIARDNIKAGDYMYVQYGHNHKNGKNGPYYTDEYWLNNYVQSLPKYYDACKNADAALIVVGPIDRHNEGQYDASTNMWSTTLAHFSRIGEQYVQCLKYGGEETAKAFLAKWKEIKTEAEAHNDISVEGSAVVTPELTALKAEADKICSDAVEAGNVQIDSVAFVDLNQPTLDWLTEVTDSGSVGGKEVTNERALTDFYFTTARGGKTDGTHPNDAGADAIAYRFFTTADTEKYPVIKPLTALFEDGAEHAEPTPIAQEIFDGGYPNKNNCWPVYDSPVKYDYALKITSVNFNAETGVLESMNTKLQDNSLMSTYGQGYVAVYNAETGALEGLALSSNHVDNTNTGDTTLEFDTDLTYNPETQTYKAFVWGYEDDPENGNPSTMVPYARAYEPTDIEAYMLPGQNGDVETFEYYGFNSIDEMGGKPWSYGGSMSHDLQFGTDDSGVTYATLRHANNEGNSFFVMRAFENIGEDGTGASGKYMLSVDLQYLSGQGLTFGFAEELGNASPFVSGTVPLFEIGADGKVTAGGKEAGKLIAGEGRWTNVTYILDMDMGTATVTVGENSPVTISVANYSSTSPVSPSTLTGFYISGNRSYLFDMKMSNMTCAKLKSDKLGDKTLTVASGDETMGTVSINGVSGNSYTAVQNTIATVSAAANEGYEFVEWKTADGATFSYELSPSVRMHEDLSLTAVFTEAVYDPITYLFKEDFSHLTTDSLAANGWVSEDAQDLLAIKNDALGNIGNYLDSTMADKSRGTVKSFGSMFVNDNGLAVTMDFKLGTPNRDSNQIVLHGGNISYADDNLNYGATGGTVIILEQSSNGAVTLNGSSTTIPTGTWVSMTAACDFTNHTADVTITSLDGSASYYSGTVNMADTSATGLEGIYLRAGRYYGAISLDNIKIFSADQLDLLQ